MDFSQIQPFWLTVLESTPEKAYDWCWKHETIGITARILRGSKMRFAKILFDEIAATMQFPGYFGENYNALNECLIDLPWKPSRAYLIVIVDSDQILTEANDSGLKKTDFEVLCEIFSRAYKKLINPVVKGELWDRPAIPFHVVMQVSPEKIIDFCSKLIKIGIKYKIMQLEDRVQ
jgi:Barstar (barnase inhibitor)